jgi:geranylgeranyl diphosphate synthase type I
VLQTRLNEVTSAVDSYLRKQVDGGQWPAELASILRYHFGWSDEQGHATAAARGKGVRPALCLLACEAAGGAWQDAIPWAAAVEMVHDFSLLHDDIEDASPVRRHRPTVWTVWGIPKAINAGDLLFAQSQLALLDAATAADRRVAATEVLNGACVSLCAGQHRDLGISPESEPSLDEYYAMTHGDDLARQSKRVRTHGTRAGDGIPASG